LEQPVLIVLALVPEYSIKSFGFYRYICSRNMFSHQFVRKKW
jgi:hypothetical protein